MKICKTCGELEALVPKTSKCRTCYNSYMREYMKRRYFKRRMEWLSRLGGTCAVCGVEDDLNFDHIDATTKQFDVAKILASASETKLSVEMAKCQILCVLHHKEKTDREGDGFILPVIHGGGKSGKKNCPCIPCKARKAEYMKNYQKPILT